MINNRYMEKQLRLTKKSLEQYSEAITVRDSEVYPNSRFNEKSNPIEWLNKFLNILKSKKSTVSDMTRLLLLQVPFAKTENDWHMCFKNFSFISNLDDNVDKKLALLELSNSMVPHLTQELGLNNLFKKNEKEFQAIQTLAHLYEYLQEHDKLYESYIRLWFTFCEIIEENDKNDYSTKTLDYSFLDWFFVSAEKINDFMLLMASYDKTELTEVEYYKRKEKLFFSIMSYTRLLKSQELKAENIYFIIKFLAKEGPDALISLKRISEEVKVFVPLTNTPNKINLTIKSNNKIGIKIKKVATKKRKLEEFKE
ncbi:hypothetical protein QEN19_002052 [Hanseniaspora menglaensis]